MNVCVCVCITHSRHSQSSFKIWDFPGSPVANVNASLCAGLCSEAKTETSEFGAKVQALQVHARRHDPENPEAS